MRRSSAVAAQAMAATSHPLATRAALRMLEDGGNAVDAAVTAAAVLCVCEPMSTGIGGDLFSIVWEDGRAHGLNSSGRAPASLDPDSLTEIAETGPRSVTVPGAVSGWAALLERFGSVGLDRCLAPAIDAAEQGFAVTPVIARSWAAIAPGFSDDEARRVFGNAPQVGQIARLPELGQSLRMLASDGPAALYDGALSDAICDASWLERADLAAHAAEWVEPLRLAHRGVEVLELPPNGQGAVALQALALVEPLAGRDAADRVHLQAEALKLAFADGYRYVADEPLPAGYLDPAYVAERRALIDRERAGSPRPGALPRGGTVYLCCVDGERRRLLAHPEPVLRLREWSRRPGDGDHAAEPRRVLHARARASEPDRAGTAAVQHDHPGHARARRVAARAVRCHGRPLPAAGASAGRRAAAGGRRRSAGARSTHRASGSISRTPGGRSRSSRRCGRSRPSSRGGGIACGAIRTSRGSAEDRSSSCTTTSSRAEASHGKTATPRASDDARRAVDSPSWR